MSDTDDTLGRKLVKALKNSAGSGRRDVSAEHDGVEARARVEGSGPYGSSIDQLEVVAPERDGGGGAGERVARQAERIERTVTYLPERLRREEVEPSLGGAVLRSRPEEMRGGEYYEFKLAGGREVDVRRHRVSADGRSRERIPQAHSHEGLERLVDDLAGVLTDPDEGDPA